ncbi:MFS transporter [Micromonospora sp. WMMD1102]|uniref:MFS transporter n=1 Tax=Micromonospora sp. WMMD1102 TaxID=3016105 RepID=UPI00241563BE|nr:MFS transporter [Micromonospora sp. WMMD1102]MDG4788587.1 MFS transporter [Micromonospora sp. WMMD1102]MDG4792131.1 MFS transporter [Micromonospora sp. WMMD1102]
MSLLRQRDFRLLWIGQGGSTFGASVTSVALPLVAVATLGASTFQVALLTAAAWLPWLLVGLPAGALVDRLRCRPVMVTCDLVAALLFASVPVAGWLGVLSVGHLLAVALAGGTVSVFFKTAYQVYLPTLLDRADLAEGNAKLQGTEAVAQVAGPGVAGLLANLFGAAAALLVNVFGFLGSAACLLSIRRPEPRRAADLDAGLGQQIAEGVRFTARDPYLRVLTVWGAVSNLGLIGYQAILVVFLVREVGLGPGTVGALVAVMSAGGVVGAAVATALSRRLGSARALLLCALGAEPFGLLIPLTAPGARLGLVVLAGVVIGAGVVAGNVIKAGFRQAYVPHRLLGRVSVTIQVVNLGTMPLGAVLTGALGTALGLRPAMWVLTGGLALTGLILLFGPLRKRRDLPEEPAVPAHPARPELVSAAGR